MLYLIPLLIAEGTVNLLTLLSYATLANVPGAINYFDVKFIWRRRNSLVPCYLIAEGDKPLSLQIIKTLTDLCVNK